MRVHFSVITIALAGMSLLVGCGGGSGTTQTSATGYYVDTTYGPTGAVVANPSVTFDGTSEESLIQCVVGATGCIVETGWQTTSAASGSVPGGTYTVTTDDVPDYWGFTTLANGNCSQNDTYPASEVINGQTVELRCGAASILFTASPSAYVYGYLQHSAAPTSITLNATSAAFPTSPSLPTVDSYNESAVLQTAVAASSVTSNQESLTFPVNSSILAAGNHILVVRNSSGNVIGAAPFYVFDVLPPSTGGCPTTVERLDITKRLLEEDKVHSTIVCAPQP